MFRHISIFTLKDKSRIDDLVDLLNEVGSCPLVVNNHIGLNLTTVPDGVKVPNFGDVVQMLDFKTKVDLDKYPSSKEHMKLFNEGPEMESVSAIDYEVSNN